MPLLVASKSDPCSNNMANYIISNYEHKEIDKGLYRFDRFYLALIEGSLLDAEWLDSKFNAEYYICLSKHSSEKSIPALTSHFTGNFNNVEYGGRSRELGYTYPSLQKEYMRNLYYRKNELERYEIIIEATHHGPTSINKPLLFIEIGSSIEEWNDMKAISIVSDTIIYTLNNIKSSKACIGLGSTHYPLKFNRLLQETDYSFGHIAPKYVLRYLDHNMIEQMLTRSRESINAIIIDWKSLGSEKSRIKGILDSYNLEVIKV